MTMSVFEIIMLVCFGAAWPVSIWRSYRSGTNAGKSVGFLIIIFVGYVSGVMHKVVFNLDAVIVLYALNALMVAVDMALYARNKRLAPGVAGT
jgi:lipopolysaccharide export LptBFGC system permease protein LptF